MAQELKHVAVGSPRRHDVLFRRRDLPRLLTLCLAKSLVSHTGLSDGCADVRSAPCCTTACSGHLLLVESQTAI